MRKIGIIAAVLLLAACGSSTKNFVVKANLAEYYFIRTVGGTEAAGINETFYFQFKEDNIIAEKMQLGELEIDLEFQGGKYVGTGPLESAEDNDGAEFRSVEVFGRLKEGDAQLHWLIDSVPLRETVFMPSVQAQED